MSASPKPIVLKPGTPILVALNPNALYPVVLDNYKGYADPPTFLFAFLSSVARDDLDGKLKLLDEKSPTIRAELAACIAIPLRAWKNVIAPSGEKLVPLPFEPANLATMLTRDELYELAEKMQAEAVLQEEALKKFESPSHSDGDKSAETVNTSAAGNAVLTGS